MKNRQKCENIDDFTHLQADPPEEILEELWELSEQQRNIIYLYYYESCTVSEIARILGMNVNTVKSGLQRARVKLKELLTEEGG